MDEANFVKSTFSPQWSFCSVRIESVCPKCKTAYGSCQLLRVQGGKALPEMVMMNGFSDEPSDHLGFCVEMEPGGCLGANISSPGTYKGVDGKERQHIALN